jgi:hypothetical protein
VTAGRRVFKTFRSDVHQTRRSLFAGAALLPLALRAALDDGAGVVLQGNSSAPAAVLSDAIDKHNERSLQRRVPLLNHSAVDPALTDERCSFWHFRFDATADLRLAARVETLLADRRVQRLCLTAPGTRRMRAADHQLQQPLVVSVMERAGSPGVPFEVEGSDFGFADLAPLRGRGRGAAARLPHAAARLTS